MKKKVNLKTVVEKGQGIAGVIPLVASFASQRPTSDLSRRNISSTIERTDKYANISSGLVPFNYSTSTSNNSNTDVKDAVVLCQKAYYNIAMFRNVIDLMTEFSVSNIYFRRGSAKARAFFDAYFRKIGLISFQEKFFREFYRSGNVFIYRNEALIQPEDVTNLSKMVGTMIASKKVKLPVKYIILNPADIQLGGTISFQASRFYKVLSDYELFRLRNPETDIEREMVQSMSSEMRKLINQTRTGIILMPLDPSKIVAAFYKRQDYEPFGVPFGYPVLEDINWKMEMKKMDMALTRAAQQSILLVTMGTETKLGEIFVNQKNLEDMQALFMNESISRVIVSDFTTKIEWKIPDIKELLGPEKYIQVDKDIQLGLNNILIGDAKFSNQYIQVQIFVKRLAKGRDSFLNDFLIPEMERIAKIVGLRDIPQPYFEDIELKDDVQYLKIYTQLMQLGILTPEEGFTAFESGKLPTPEESMESQQKLKDAKKDGLYEPLMGGPFSNLENTKVSGQFQMQSQQLKQANGRPSGSTGIPQSTKKIKPRTMKGFGMMAIKENILLSDKLQEKVEQALMANFKLKELNATQKEICAQITQQVTSNEEPKDWLAKSASYIENPVDKNKERIEKIQALACEHGIEPRLASILYASQTEVPCPNPDK